MKKINLVVMEEIEERLKIEIKEFSYFMNEQNDLTVLEGYK